jgi:hypothetical protein
MRNITTFVDVFRMLIHDVVTVMLIKQCELFREFWGDFVCMTNGINRDGLSLFTRKIPY